MLMLAVETMAVNLNKKENKNNNNNAWWNIIHLQKSRHAIMMKVTVTVTIRASSLKKMKPSQSSPAHPYDQLVCLQRSSLVPQRFAPRDQGH